MSDQTFGWELLFQNLKKDIQKKEDVLMILIHFSLIKNGFQCIGVGDEEQTEENEIQSELLPKGWNAKNEYVIRYKLENLKCVLRSCRSENNTIVFNLMNSEQLKIYNVMFNYEESVAAIDGILSDLLPTYKDLLEIIRRDLVQPFINNKKKNVDTQTQTQPAEVRVNRVHRILDIDDDDSDSLRLPPRNIGRSDLNPLGFYEPPGGGGMLFDPFSRNRRQINPSNPLGGPARLPRGAIPPGARFDPFGPPDSERFRRPDRSPPDFFS